MTPQLVPSHNAAESRHLSEDQFGDLLVRSSANTQAGQHLAACDRCAAELAAMRESLVLFRDASRAHADNELRRLPEMTLPSRRLASTAPGPAWWLTAAAMLLTVLSPMEMQRMRGFHSYAVASSAAPAGDSGQSDEALLDDVDREASASVPSPMQALADPSASLETSTPLATQRKD
jgi:anti-sigma factor RsiW